MHIFFFFFARLFVVFKIFQDFSFENWGNLGQKKQKGYEYCNECVDQCVSNIVRMVQLKIRKLGRRVIFFF